MADDNSPRVLYDPGWNDPPVLAYDSHNNHVKKSYPIKRTSYSLEDIDPAKQCSANIAVKSVHNALSPPPATTPKWTLVDSAINVVQSDASKPIALEVILKNLQCTIEETQLGSSEKEANEIERRLKLMERMWHENKFPDDVKLKLGSISEALQGNDLITCDNLQRSLMVDYTSLCSSWMVAIRSLINSKRSLMKH